MAYNRCFDKVSNSALSYFNLVIYVGTTDAGNLVLHILYPNARRFPLSRDIFSGTLYKIPTPIPFYDLVLFVVLSLFTVGSLYAARKNLFCLRWENRPWKERGQQIS